MLSFNEFTQYVKEETERAFPEAKVTVNEVKKNNNLTLTAITVRPEGSSISPNIYLDRFYEEYEDGESLDTVIAKITRVAEDNFDAPAGFTGIAEKFTKWDEIKNSIIFSLVNGEKNKELLENAPHVMFEDLAILFKVFIGDGNNGFGSITILNDHIKYWDVTVEDLMAAAKANVENLLPATVQTMGEVLMEMMAKDGMPEEMAELFRQEMPLTKTMFVISNKQKVNGAGSVLYKDVLADLSAKIGTDLYILPSSIHEVIVVSEEMGDPETLRQMVCEVNGTEVRPEEQLSDNVYKYCREAGTLSVV